MAFSWRADDEPIWNAGLVHGVAAICQGIRTCIARKPNILRFFRGGGGGPDHLSPSGSTHVGNVDNHSKFSPHAQRGVISGR